MFAPDSIVLMWLIMNIWIKCYGPDCHPDFYRVELCDRFRLGRLWLNVMGECSVWARKSLQKWGAVSFSCTTTTTNISIQDVTSHKVANSFSSSTHSRPTSSFSSPLHCSNYLTEAGRSQPSKPPPGGLCMLCGVCVGRLHAHSVH